MDWNNIWVDHGANYRREIKERNCGIDPSIGTQIHEGQKEYMLRTG